MLTVDLSVPLVAQWYKVYAGHMLRNTTIGIYPALTRLFNNSTKISPCLENPIPKSSVLSHCSNYRPISLLSLPSKILERIVHNRVSEFLSKHNLLSRVQFGFRSHSFTQEALLSVTNTWQTMLSKHKLIAAVFLDVKKAFDSVSHHQLIHSLHSIGIQGSLLNWFRDYLSRRSQRVV